MTYDEEIFEIAGTLKSNTNNERYIMTSSEYKQGTPAIRYGIKYRKEVDIPSKTSNAGLHLPRWWGGDGRG